MPSITNVKIVDGSITKNSATASWETTAPGTTGMNLGKVIDSNPPVMNCLGNDNGQVRTHTYDFTGLDAGCTYRYLPISQDDSGTDYNLAPGTVIADFTTLTDATVYSIKASCRRIIKLGDVSDITAAVIDSAGAAMAGQKVSAAITNNPAGSVRGTVSPDSADTDQSGSAAFVFTGTARGTADIKLVCGGVEKKVSVWVCSRLIDLILAALGIRF